MKILLDASTIINLLNSGCFNLVLSISYYQFYISEFVDEECLDELQMQKIDSAISEGRIKKVSEQVNFSEFATYKNTLNLGDGETECILLAYKNSSYVIATDDGTARKRIIKLLGKSRLTGSLALLREAYRNTILTCDEVKIFYSIMIIKGGFLPAVDENFLCS